MPTVSVIGSGNVGANAAFFIAEKGVCEVGLYDLIGGLASGKALDMMEAAPMRGYPYAVRGLQALDDIAGSDVVVLAAGAVRSAEMQRGDLIAANGSIADELGGEIARLTPNAVVVVTTEPVDRITERFVAASGMPREQVIGVGGLLDATRFRYAVARELALSRSNVSSLVIGRHSSDMLILDRYTRVSGVPLGRLVSQSRIDALKQETREAGQVLLDLAQRSSAYYAPSAAVAELVAAVVLDLHRILPVSIMLAGEYGLGKVALSLPCVVARGGVERVLIPRLTEHENTLLVASAAAAGAVPTAAATGASS
jgi:malate dehydrogenase